MVRDGAIVTASISGSTGFWEGSDIRGELLKQLPLLGDVRQLVFDSKMFLSAYTSTLVIRVRGDYASQEDIRATIAGMFETVIGIRPAVTLTRIDGQATGEGIQQAGNSMGAPGGFDLGSLTTFGIVAIALVLVVTLAPSLRKVAG